MELHPPVKLLPGEEIVAVQELDLADPPTMPDALEELCKLTGVERPEEIGENGPAVGARATEANAGESAVGLFEVVFGRDSLTVALLVADLFPRLLETTVRCVPHSPTRFESRSSPPSTGCLAVSVKTTSAFSRTCA